MKFSVGYQLTPSREFVDEIIGKKDKVSEVYFAFGGFSNGRNNKLLTDDFAPWDAQARQIEDLAKISENGIKLNLLLNATCYGKNSQARSFFEKIGETVDFLSGKFGLYAITTTSPLIAKFIKSNFDDVHIRASVNMEIGTVDGMQYIKDFFDSFYVKRELNHNFAELKVLKKWCGDNGKELFALANSGCLNNCSAHIFHDNLVSHESEISEMDNGFMFEGVCRKYIKGCTDYGELMKKSNFIRPEDVHLYEDIFSSLKLATRVNKNPAKILRAYTNEKYSGSVFSLLEPDNTALLYPYIMENSLISASVENDRLCYGVENALIKPEEYI